MYDEKVLDFTIEAVISYIEKKLNEYFPNTVIFEISAYFKEFKFPDLARRVILQTSNYISDVKHYAISISYNGYSEVKGVIAVFKLYILGKENIYDYFNIIIYTRSSDIHGCILTILDRIPKIEISYPIEIPTVIAEGETILTPFQLTAGLFDEKAYIIGAKVYVEPFFNLYKQGKFDITDILDKTIIIEKSILEKQKMKKASKDYFKSLPATTKVLGDIFYFEPKDLIDVVSKALKTFDFDIGEAFHHEEATQIYFDKIPVNYIYKPIIIDILRDKEKIGFLLLEYFMFMTIGGILVSRKRLVIKKDPITGERVVTEIPVWEVGRYVPVIKYYVRLTLDINANFLTFGHIFYFYLNIFGGIDELLKGMGKYETIRYRIKGKTIEKKEFIDLYELGYTLKRIYTRIIDNKFLIVLEIESPWDKLRLEPKKRKKKSVLPIK
ncbi:MAG: hypothetical protein QXX03_05760 [Nitrososphaerota archaeon]